MKAVTPSADPSLLPTFSFLICRGSAKGMTCEINEEKFIAQYVKLTGANESLARNIYMHLEPAHYRALTF